MTIKLTDTDFFNVQFELKFIWEDPSYDDEFGTVELQDGYVLEDITWDKDAYSERVNEIIQAWVNENREEYEKSAVEAAYAMRDDVIRDKRVDEYLDSRDNI